MSFPVETGLQKRRHYKTTCVGEYANADATKGGMFILLSLIVAKLTNFTQKTKVFHQADIIHANDCRSTMPGPSSFGPAKV